MKIKAAPGKVIVRFRPYEREGKIIIPDRHKPESCEATIVSDGDGEWPEGQTCIVSIMQGEYFRLDENSEDRLCHVKRSGVLMLTIRNGDRTEKCWPAHRAILTTKEEPEKELAGGLIQWPQAFEKRRDYGTILAVGPGVLDLQEGDIAHFPWDKAMGFKIDGMDALLVYEKDVAGFSRVEQNDVPRGTMEVA